MRNIEHADRRPRGLVLLNDGAVLNRHRPARKIDHPAAVVDMPLIQRGLEHGSGNRQLTISRELSRKRLAEPAIANVEAFDFGAQAK